MTERCEVMSPDTEGQRLVDSSKVLERENPDQTRLINADRMLIRFWLLTGHCTASDRTLGVQHPVDISKVPVRGKRDRTRPISVDRTLPASDQLLTTGVRGVLTGASGQHDRSVWSPRRGT